MASNSKAKLTDGSSNMLEAQKTQLVLAFTQVAHAMRQAANEAEAYANLVQNLGPDGKLSANTMNNFRDRQVFPFSAAIQSGALASTSPTAINGVEPPATKKRVRKERETKPRAPKDPHAPKRPASAYLLFQNEVRKEFTERLKGESYHTILNAIAKAWADMDPVKKQQYTDRTSEAKKTYNVEKAAYDLTKAVVSPTIVAAPVLPAPSTSYPLHDATPDEEVEAEVEIEEEDTSEEVPSSSEESEESEDEDAQPAKKSKLGPAPPRIATAAELKKDKAKADKKKARK